MASSGASLTAREAAIGRPLAALNMPRRMFGWESTALGSGVGAAVGTRFSRVAEKDSACGIAAVGTYGQLVDGLALNAPVALRRRPPTT